MLVLKVGDIRTPIWPNPPETRNTELPTFCPKEHRTTIIEKFRRHLHLHPEIPLNDKTGTFLTANEIHRGAVKDIYEFCFQKDLAQVWAYLWNRWYCETQWTLWARVACDAIPRLKTTMIVESLWKQIKRRDLHQFNRPRLDLVTYVVLKNLLPHIRQKIEYMKGLRREGRPMGLASWQKSFKKDWMDMSKPDELWLMVKELTWLKAPVKTKGRAERLAEINEEMAWPQGNYHTDINRWTCSCPSYLISRFLLCKHLVRLANTMLDDKPLTDLQFFWNLRRHHYPPYYSISGIHTNAGECENTDDLNEVQVLLLGHKGGSISMSSTPRSSSPAEETWPGGSSSTAPVDAAGKLDYGGLNGCGQTVNVAESQLNMDPDDDNNQHVSNI
jgi:SWIM zinc finger.